MKNLNESGRTGREFSLLFTSDSMSRGYVVSRLLCMLISFSLLCLVSCDDTESSDTTGKKWTHPADLNDYFSPAGSSVNLSYSLSMNNSGDVVVAWQQDDIANPSRRQVFFSHLLNGKWTHPLNLRDNISLDGYSAQGINTSMDDNGNAMILWHQSDGTRYRIFMSEYRYDNWAHPTSFYDFISLDSDGAVYPYGAMDNNSNALVAWKQEDSSGSYQIFLSQLRDSYWDHPGNLSDNISPDSWDASSPHIAMDNNGNALVVWHQNNGGSPLYSQIYVSQYRDSSWDPPADLTENISPEGESAVLPRAAMDDNGNAIVIWRQSDGADDQLFMSQYRNGSWVHPSGLTDNISPDGQDVEEHQVVMANNGDAMIVWLQSDGASDRIFVSHYRNGSWDHPSDLDDNFGLDGSNAISPHTAMDDKGNAILVWQQHDGDFYQIYMSQYRNGTWSHPADLSDSISPDGDNASEPLAAMANNGNALIVWRQDEGSQYQMYKSEYK